MAYTPTTWNNNKNITPDLLNKMQQGIKSASLINGIPYDAIIYCYRESSNTFTCVAQHGNYSAVTQKINASGTPNILIQIEDLIGFENENWNYWTTSSITVQQLFNPFKFRIMVPVRNTSYYRIFHFKWTSSDIIDIDSIDLTYLTNSIIVGENYDSASSVYKLNTNYKTTYNNFAMGKPVFIQEANLVTLNSSISTAHSGGVHPVIGVYKYANQYRLYALQQISNTDGDVSLGNSVTGSFMGLPAVRTYTASSSIDNFEYLGKAWVPKNYLTFTNSANWHIQ